MKKFLATIIALLYLAASTGATVQMHYCMDKLVELNLSLPHNEQCGNCGMEKKPQADNGCCKDEQKQVKIESDHLKSVVAFEALHLIADAFPSHFIEITPARFSSESEENPRSHAPPRISGLALYKRNCVFRI